MLQPSPSNSLVRIDDLPTLLGSYAGVLVGLFVSVFSMWIESGADQELGPRKAGPVPGLTFAVLPQSINFLLFH